MGIETQACKGKAMKGARKLSKVQELVTEHKELTLLATKRWRMTVEFKNPRLQPHRLPNSIQFFDKQEK